MSRFLMSLVVVTVLYYRPSEAQLDAFTWGFVGASTLPECGTSTIKVINTRSDGSPGVAVPPFTMFSYEPGGTTVDSALVGSDSGNLQWTVPHSAGSQVFLQVVDSNGFSGGIAGSLFTVTSGPSTSCHGGVTASFKMSTTATSLRTCDPFVIDFSGGSKPYIVSIISQKSNVVTNFTMGPNDDEFTYINRAPPNAPLIVTAHDSTGKYTLNTNLINVSGSTDTTCGNVRSSTGVRGALASAGATPSDTPSTPSQGVGSNGNNSTGGSSNSGPSASSSGGVTNDNGVVSPSTSPPLDVTATLSSSGALITESQPSPTSDGSSPTSTSNTNDGPDTPAALPVSSSSHVNVGALAGGATVAVLLLVGLMAFLLVMRARRKRTENPFDDEDDPTMFPSTPITNSIRGTGLTSRTGSTSVEQRINPFIPPPREPLSVSTFFNNPAPSVGSSPGGFTSSISPKRQMMMTVQNRNSASSPLSPFSPSPTMSHPYAAAYAATAVQASPSRTRDNKIRPSSSSDSPRPSSSASSNVPLLFSLDGQRPTSTATAQVVRRESTAEVPPPYNYPERI